MLAPALQRPRLLRIIDEPTLSPITLITAPAGYGKTTLADQWRHTADHPVVWLALGPECNSLPRFLAAVMTAMDRAGIPSVAETGEGVTFDQVMARFSQCADQGRVTMVADDYHEIVSDDVHHVVDTLLASLPDNLHVILLSRTVPPLALGRLRVHGQVRELTGAELGFTRDEARTVIARDAQGRIANGGVDSLVERTDGWIAAIRLALASMGTFDAVRVAQTIDRLAASPWLDDYLVEEVLGALPDELRTFVLHTVHLPLLDSELCDHALGISNSASLLRQTRRQVVFTRAGSEPGSLSYHALFAECVQRIAARELPAGHVPAVHRRAAAWFESHGRRELALEHAIAARAWDDSVRLARELSLSHLVRSHHHSRLHWLRRLPERLVLNDPELAWAYVSALQYTGHFREARRAFEAVDPAWQQSGNPVHRGYSSSIRAFFAVVDGDPEGSLRHCYNALRCYPLEFAAERLHAWWGIFHAEFQRGHDQVASQAFRQAEHCRDHLPSDQFWWVLAIEPERSNQRALRGDLSTAVALSRATLAHLPAIYRGYEPKFRARLAAILLEQGELEQAAAEVERIERDLLEFPHHLWHPEAQLTVAMVAGALDDAERMATAIQRFREMSEAQGGAIMHDRLHALQASVWLATGQIGLAREWAATARGRAYNWVRIFGDPDPRLMIARVDIAGGAYARASQQLQILIDGAIAARRWAELVPLATWQAVARLGLEDENGALEALRLALKYGGPGGFVRSFATPGYDLRPFLERSLDRFSPEEAAFLRRLGLVEGKDAPQPLTAPVPGERAAKLALSQREIEVLRLMREGQSNRDIAKALYITEHTAKKHVSSILLRLGVPNRTAAIVMARKLGLD
jgi:LuxR family maltose regulon positive regulatory protein